MVTRTIISVGLWLLLLVTASPAMAMEKIYWTDLETNKIQRANIDGSNVEDIIDLGPDACACLGPAGLVLAGGKLYWSDASSGTIKRANPNGTTVTPILSGLGTASGLALDLAGAKMYWADQSAGTIHRANLDGTSIELLVSALSTPTEVALDLTAGKMYWIDFSASKIQRANLDGSSVEDVVPGAGRGSGLALALSIGKLYWTDFDADNVKRANLDGTGVEVLVTGLSNPQGIALDLPAGKMYWADDITNKIQRANLDGSSVEDVVTTGLGNPNKVARASTDEVSDLGPALVWVGLKSSDDVGLRLDLRVEVFVNSTANAPIGTGQVNNVSSGSSGFSNALLSTIPIALTSGPVEVTDGDELLLMVAVRRTCSGGGHTSGTPRLWYNGRAVDSGAARDAGSRLSGAVIDAESDTFYLRTDFTLSTTAGTSKTFIDQQVNTNSPCPNRPFTPFGTWSTAP
jgi:Low-density lipoprotein receptor repeat class B